jgi:hypothetical protein
MSVGKTFYTLLLKVLYVYKCMLSQWWLKSMHNGFFDEVVYDRFWPIFVTMDAFA